ncbi:permease, partial [Halosimplex halobium]|uniref:permease n=1 Tax=Halosimplex halobium TaxID=3396618 RepID=UPI003F564FC4
MSLTDATLRAVALVAEMTWDTWWALVLGFTLSGAVEAFVGEDRMTRALGGDGWREVGLGAALGAASSSCSYSAVGTTKTLFKKGGSGVATLGAFMFASTDLVVELGFVLWVLLGWQFVVGEYLGGVVAVLVLAVVFRRVIPDSWVEDAREHVRATDGAACPACSAEVDPTDPDAVRIETGAGVEFACCGGCRRVYEARSADSDDTRLRDRVRSRAGWASAARATMKDWEMVWRDVALGFVVAGLVGGFVPDAWWAAAVPEGTGLAAVTAATVVAVAVGAATFMCSVGNVPFALVLWTHGVPFGAVLSFIYADLLIPPLVRLYREYYGIRMAATLTAALAVAAVVAGVVVHYVAGGLGIVPPAGEVGGTVPGGYTLALNALATPVALAQVTVTYGLDAVRARTAAAIRTADDRGRAALRVAGGGV